MRNLLAFLAAALLTFAGLGWYLDWYTISSTQASGHRQVNINFNTSKIGEDFEKGGQKVRKILEKSDKNAPETNAAPKKDQPAKDAKPAPAPQKP
jgi:hypothetical protein